jgi:hypothetical protein
MLGAYVEGGEPVVEVRIGYHIVTLCATEPGTRACSNNHVLYMKETDDAVLTAVEKVLDPNQIERQSRAGAPDRVGCNSSPQKARGGIEGA